MELQRVGYNLATKQQEQQQQGIRERLKVRGQELVADAMGQEKAWNVVGKSSSFHGPQFLCLTAEEVGPRSKPCYKSLII